MAAGHRRGAVDHVAPEGRVAGVGLRGLAHVAGLPGEDRPEDAADVACDVEIRKGKTGRCGAENPQHGFGLRTRGSHKQTSGASLLA